MEVWIRQSMPYHPECDASVIIIRPEMGHMSLDEVANRLELFAREVLPVVQKA